MKKYSLILLLPAPMALAAENVYEMAKITELWEPVPPLVSTGSTGSAPSDAIVLFNGTDLSEWESVKGGDPSQRFLPSKASAERVRKPFIALPIVITLSSYQGLTRA